MIRFLLRRLGAAIVLILVLSAIIFVLRSISTGDPERTPMSSTRRSAGAGTESVSSRITPGRLPRSWVLTTSGERWSRRIAQNFR